VSLEREELIRLLEQKFNRKRLTAVHFLPTADRQFFRLANPDFVSEGSKVNSLEENVAFHVHLKPDARVGTILTVSSAGEGFLIAFQLLIYPILWLVVPLIALYQKGLEILLIVFPVVCGLSFGLYTLLHFAKKREQSILDSFVNVLAPFAVIEC
jgi:hypothetical protein